jgi:hypothetical protein
MAFHRTGPIRSILVYVHHDDDGDEYNFLPFNGVTFAL